MYNYNSGYVGSKMSIRAKEAYGYGAKPYTKWSKQDILDELGEKSSSVKKYSVSTLREYFLVFDSWHHTSSFFNKTDFYTVGDFDINFEELDAIEKRNKEEKEKAKLEKPILAYCKYGVWSGTKRHPKLMFEEDYCIVKNNWAYFSFGKKSLDGKHIEILEKYTRAPKGKGDIFKEIRRKYKL